jgi:hypothetical protein
MASVSVLFLRPGHAAKLGLANTEVDAHSQLLGPSMEELEKIPKELKGTATL